MIASSRPSPGSVFYSWLPTLDREISAGHGWDDTRPSRDKSKPRGCARTVASVCPRVVPESRPSKQEADVVRFPEGTTISAITPRAQTSSSISLEGPKNCSVAVNQGERSEELDNCESWKRLPS